MEPIEVTTDITSSELNSSLARIHKIADKGPASFKKNAGTLLGRNVYQEVRGEKVPLNLIESVHILARAHAQHSLTFGNSHDAKKSCDALVRDLKHIKLYLEEDEFSDIPKAKNLIEEIDRLTKHLKPKGKKRTHSDVEQVMLSPKVMALVADTENIVSSLWKLGFILVDASDLGLRFFNGLENAIDDDSLQLILETPVVFGEDDKTLADVTWIDLAQYPYLDAKAPALLVKHLKNLDRTCFRTIATQPRFLDYSVKVGDKRIPTNKALLLEESEDIQYLAGETDGQLELSDPLISLDTIELFLEILIGESDLDLLSFCELCKVAIFAEKYNCKKILALIEEHLAQPDFKFKYSADDLPIVLPLYKTMCSRKGLDKARHGLVNHLQNMCRCLVVGKIQEALNVLPGRPSPQEIAELYGRFFLEIVTLYQTEYPEVCLVWLERELYNFKRSPLAGPPKDFEDEKDFHSTGTEMVHLQHQDQSTWGHSYRIIESGKYLDLMLLLGTLCEKHKQAVAAWNIDLPRYHCVLGRIYSSGCKGMIANGQLAEKHLNIAIELTKAAFSESYVPSLYLLKLYASGAAGMAPDLEKAKELLKAIPATCQNSVVYLNAVDLVLRRKLTPDYNTLWQKTRLRQLIGESGRGIWKRKEYLIDVVAYLFSHALISDHPTIFQNQIANLRKNFYKDFLEQIRRIQGNGGHGEPVFRTTSTLLFDIANVLYISALKRRLVAENLEVTAFTAETELEPYLAKMEQTATALKTTIQYSPCGHIYAELLDAARNAAKLTSLGEVRAVESPHSPR